MKKPFPWLLVAIVAALLAGAIFLPDPARAQFGAMGALIVASIPLRHVRGATPFEIVLVVAGAGIALYGVDAAIDRKTWGWTVAGFGDALIFATMRRRAEAVFGVVAGRCYLIALALIVGAVATYTPASVAVYGAKVARASSVLAALALASAAATWKAKGPPLEPTGGSSSRTRP